MSGVHSVGLRHSLTFTSTLNSFKELLSNPQFRDGLKIFFIGAAITTSKSIAEAIWNEVKHVFIAEISIRQTDEAYLWVMHYFSKHVDWNKAREVEVRSRRDLKAEESSESDSPEKDGPFYFPLPSHSFSLTFKGVRMWASRERELVGDTSWDETLHLTFLSLSNKTTRDFILTSKEQYQEFERGKVISYKADRYTHWSRNAAMSKRSAESVHLPGDVKEKVLDDVASFLSSETQRWYSDRGIPYRRGYLLHGTPGTGKSSLVHVIASELSLPIYSLSLSSRGIDDAKLQELLDEVPSQAIVLLEDIDAAFTSRSNSEDSTRESSTVSFSALLNVLDGIGAPEGRIVVMTTNHRTKLDSALVRPGRIDVEIPFQNCSKSQAKSLFERWYPNRREDNQSEKSSKNFDLQDLASKFSDLFQEDTVSMAALQGYLLSHRFDPEAAIRGLSTWLKEMKENKE